MKKNNINVVEARATIENFIPCKNLKVEKRNIEKRLENFSITLIAIEWNKSKGIINYEIIDSGCKNYVELKTEYKQHASEYLFENLEQVEDRIKGLNKKRFLNPYEHSKGTYNYRLGNCRKYGNNFNLVYVKSAE